MYLFLCSDIVWYSIVFWCCLGFLLLNQLQLSPAKSSPTNASPSHSLQVIQAAAGPYLSRRRSQRRNLQTMHCNGCYNVGPRTGRKSANQRGSYTNKHTSLRVIPALTDFPHILYLVGGIPTHLKNMSSSIGMMTFPTNIWKVIKFIFQTTNQIWKITIIHYKWPLY